MAMEQEQGQGSNPTPAGQQSRNGWAHRSLFWGVVVIGLGVIWLLSGLDVLTAHHLAMLTYVWPILLIGIGVDLLIGRRSPTVGGLVGVVTVGLMIVFMLLGPAFGWTGNTELKTDTFGTPVDAANSAQVSIDTGGYSATIHALQSSSGPERPLVDAHVTYRGVVEFQSSGDAQKTVSIEPKGQRWWWQFLDLEGAEPWDIGLDPEIPMDLSVKSSSGSADVDLSGVVLTGLDIGMSSGDLQLALPALPDKRYETELHMSSGDMEVTAAAGAGMNMGVDMSSGDVRVVLGEESDVTVRFDGSSGRFALELAAGQAYRVEVAGVSSGDVNLPSGLVQVATGDDDEEGIWETQGYAEASRKVLLIVEHMSSGDVDVKQGS
jgi:Toastrack DUF4097/LiaF transmembrane domain